MEHLQCLRKQLRFSLLEKRSEFSVDTASSQIFWGTYERGPFCSLMALSKHCRRIACIGECSAESRRYLAVLAAPAR